ncbi:putative nuclease HARBI1 isoform X2 [Drosophila obscura]|uniref:putative nuclease HARBI1 isoform X2 n=1 Tax=Drosophila obscura TaxID=7282 RepID=UPI001BB1E9B3|nr:putative nuclease HARBI1 isoform X2 [Drosophila obscura]
MDARRKLLIVGLAALVVAEEEDNERRKRRRHWYENIYRRPSVFFENFHMTEKDFCGLFGLVEPYLVPNRNTRPEAIPPKAKLAIVLEFLASGDLQRHVCSTYRISKQHFEVIIGQVCEAICISLSKEFPKWHKDSMLQWAKDFEEEWNFPNCIGAVGGKHVAIKAPPNSGSRFCNYKGFHSIVLMAICDAHYRFTYIDVGACGSEGDMNAFSQCEFGKALLSETLNFPDDNALNGERTPYFIVGDDAFPLHKRIMKPFGSRNLAVDERVFNYRLSRARRCIETAFGILCARWMAVQRTLLSGPEKSQNIVAACCSLHNFLLRTSPSTYAINEDSLIKADTVFTDLRPCCRGRPHDFCKSIRVNLKNFVNSPAGSVAWQNEAAGVQNN